MKALALAVVLSVSVPRGRAHWWLVTRGGGW